MKRHADIFEDTGNTKKPKLTSKKRFPSRKKSIIDVSIDNGTTRVCIGYDYVDEDAVQGTIGQQVRGSIILTRYPNAPGAECTWVPATFLYSLKDHGSGSIHRILNWGFDVQEAKMKIERAKGRGEKVASETVKLVKLLLHASEKTKEETRLLKDLASRLGMTALALVEEHLSKIMDFIFGYFLEIHSEWMELSPLMRFKVGVPPSWTDSENAVFHGILQKVLDAEVAKLNGSNEISVEVEISLGSEPEATAVVYAARNEHIFRINDTIIIPDLGGGTTVSL